MKVFLLGIFVMLSGCGLFDPKSEDKVGEDRVALPADIATIVSGSCATSGCHAGGNIVDLESSVQQLRSTNSLNRIKAKTMPPQGTGAAGRFYGSADETKLIAFLESDELPKKDDGKRDGY